MSMHEREAGDQANVAALIKSERDGDSPAADQHRQLSCRVASAGPPPNPALRSDAHGAPEPALR
jgi:hypothetical protein